MDNENTGTRVEAPDSTECPPSSQMIAHSYDGSILNLPRRIDPEAGGHGIHSFLKCKRNLNICTFNVRTLNQSHSFGEIALEAKNKNLDIIAIQEHRICHEDPVLCWDLSQHHTLITTSAWKNSINASTGGVGLICHNKYFNLITSVEKVTDRILKVVFTGNPTTTVLSCYSPTNTPVMTEAASTFYNKLSDTIDSIPKHNFLLMCGDFNAKLGPEAARFSYNSATNRNGDALVDLIEEHDLVVTNTSFQKPSHRLWTFKYPHGGKTQLDYIIVRKKWSKSVINVNAYTKTFQTIQSDHRAVIAQIQLKLRSNKQRPSSNNRPNFNLLKNNPDLQQQYAIAVKNRFSALAETDSVVPANYNLLEQACKEEGLKLLPRTKRDNWVNLSSKDSVKEARARLKQATQTNDSRAVKQAKCNLRKAYTDEETKYIEAKTRDLEQKYYHNQHSAAWKIIKDITENNNT